MSVILILGCSNVICNKPYILVGESCCLDQNSNAVCDKDESTIPAAIEQAEQLSEQPDLAKFNEYLKKAELGKLPPGVQVGPPNFPILTKVFTAEDQFCSNLEIIKTIPASQIATAVYDVKAKIDIKPKSVFPMELKAGGTSGCEPLVYPAGKYEYKIYLEDILVAVLPFEVR